MQLLRRINDVLFSGPPEELTGPRGVMLKVGQVVYLLVGKFRRDFCLERAASLTFYSIISLIPMTVLFFSFATKFMGERERIKEWFILKIPKLLAPGQEEKVSTWLKEDIGSDAFQLPEDSSWLMDFTAVCGLVIISLGIFIAAERVFNHIWQVDKRRNYLQRVLVFWVILTTSPLLFGASLWAEDMLPTGGLKSFLQDSPYFAAFLAFLAFTLMYIFMPATKVRFRSAVIGGIVAAILWQLAKYGFLYYLDRINNVTRFYNKIAALPLFLIWLYVTWMVVLCGAQLSFVHQNLAALSRVRRARSARGKRSFAQLGLHLLYRVGAAFNSGGKAPSLEAVANDLGLEDSEGLAETASVLLQQNVLLGDGSGDGRYALARNPAHIRLKEVMAGLRKAEFPGEKNTMEPAAGSDHDQPDINRLIASANASWEGSFESFTLADMLPLEGKKTDSQAVAVKQDRESD